MGSCVAVRPCFVTVYLNELPLPLTSWVILALALAAGGLHVVSYVVSLRWREMGIRLALGAGCGAIVALILKQALAPTSIGAAVKKVEAPGVAPRRQQFQNLRERALFWSNC